MTSSTNCASPKRVAHYASALHAFTSSTSTFRVLHSIPTRASSQKQPLPAPKHLYILDSSFNPPTLAHLRIARSALEEDKHAAAQKGPKRLLLLLATQNADKAPKPAAFEQRLVMMEVFAEELLAAMGLSTAHQGDPEQEIPENSQNHNDGARGNEIQGIDIALTTEPYFVDKSNAISEHSDYPASSTTQIHLTGFDTLIRILNPKYYPPSHTLHSLQPFLSRHRLRVTYRTEPMSPSSPISAPSPAFSTLASQDEYLEAIASGERQGEGALPSWILDGRIVMVEGRKEGEPSISSTKVREALDGGDGEALDHLVPKRIASYVLCQQLYQRP